MGMNMEFIKNDAYSGELDYRAFGSMLDHPTQCYKFYWLEAIMNLMLKKYRFSLRHHQQVWVDINQIV